VCLTNNIPLKVALILLSNLVSKHPNGPMWFTTYISKAGHSNLSTVKASFFSQFLSDEAQTDRFQELLEIRYRSNETVRSFSNRFIEKMRLNEITLNSEDVAHSYVKKIYFYKLPASVRRFPGAVDLSTFKSTQELIEKMCKFPGVPEDIKKFSQRCYQCNQHVNCSRCPGLVSEKNLTPNGVNGLKRKVSGDKRNLKVSLSEDNSPKGRLCYNDCGQIFMPGHECPKKGAYQAKKEQKRIAKAVIISEDQESSSLKEFERDLDLLCSKLEVAKIPGISSSFNYVPLLLNKKKYLAGVDSMATHSIISPKIAKELNICLLPQSGTITLANNSIIKRIGKTSFLEVKCKDITIDHCFEIMETGGTGIILGRDLFDIFGITLSGLPVDFPNEKPTKENLIAEERHQDSNKVDFLKYLKLFIESNQNISRPCTFPGSTLGLKFNQEYKGPVIKRQYPLPYRSKVVVNEWVEKELQRGHIKEVIQASAWNSPLIVVPKRNTDGTVKGHRICIDPRHINLVLENNSFPLPLIKEIFESLKGMSYFSKIDLESGFNQFLLDDRSQEITTFTWNDKQYVFTVCPFGFKIVPAHFQSIMSKIFQKFSFVKVYIDDIIVFSNSLIQHKTHLSKVFQELNSFNLKVKLEKCEFGMREIILLGYKISQKGIQVCREKLLQMKQWKVPKTGKELQSQLGFINYFRDLIPLYADILSPLEKLRNFGF
jgi:ribosomal protein L32